MDFRLSSFNNVRTFFAVGTCSEMSCNVLDRAFRHPSKPEEHATAPLAGGIMQHGYQCGLVWGPPLAAGAQAYRLFGPGPRAEAAALNASQRLVDVFRKKFGDIHCMELTGCDWKKASKIVRYFVKGTAVKCFGMAAKYPPLALREINAALSEEQKAGPDSPVSCTALLARKLGASDLQAAMAAGWAGGLGLSGSACGALAVAIWMSGLKRLEQGEKLKFFDPKTMEIIERFLKNSDYEFECSHIAGRTFEDVADHARYLREGGCAKILETF